MSTEFKKFLTISFIFLITIILSIIFAPLGGYIHNSFWEFQGCWFWGICDQNSLVEGFIYAYILLLALFSFSILKQKTAWLTFIFGTILFWVMQLFFIFTEGLSYMKDEYIGSLIIMVCSSITGWLLAQGSLLIYKKFKKT